jgi:hypothetical protein
MIPDSSLLQQVDSISKGTYHRRRNTVKTDIPLQATHGKPGERRDSNEKLVKNRRILAGPRERPILDESPALFDHVLHLLIRLRLGAAVGENYFLFGVLSSVLEKHAAPPGIA